jgi:hypothetical protein
MRRALPLTVVMIALLGCGGPTSTGPGRAARPDETEEPEPKEGQWRKFTSAEGKFSVSFPGRPKQRQDGGISRFSVQLPTARYDVDCYDVTAELIKAWEGPEGYIKHKSESSPDDRKSTRTFKLLGHPACERVHDAEYEAEGNQPSVKHVREVLVGLRMYELTVEMVKGKEDAEARERFFDSFQLAE